MNTTNKTKKITTEDKVLIALKLMPVNLIERFAMDCASRATAYAAKSVHKAYATYAAQAVSHASSTAYAASYAAAYAAAYYASLAATYTAHAASYAARLTASAEERELQLKSIAQLIEGNK